MTLLSNHAQTLSPVARRMAELTARRLFAARGNKSEVHLNEYELALCIAAAVEAALRSAIDKAVQP